MQKAEKLNESAGPTEQNLPVPATSAGSVVPSKTVRQVISATDSEKSEASLPVGSSQTDSAATREIRAATESASISNPVRTVERAHDLMALHALRLRDSGNDSMQIVIKPSSDLHIALNLEMRDGTVQVNAQLQRGDYEFLNRHWTDLQQQMESRGVKLAPLTNQNQSQSPASNGNLSQQSPGRQSPEEKASRTGAFAEFALAGVLVPKPSTKTTAAARGWESWA